MSYILDDNFLKYGNELLKLKHDYPDDSETSWEITHRKKILEEWIDNELEKLNK